MIRAQVRALPADTKNMTLTAALATLPVSTSFATTLADRLLVILHDNEIVGDFTEPFEVVVADEAWAVAMDNDRDARNAAYAEMFCDD